MGRTNANNLPESLRKGPDGAYILDFRMTPEDGSRRRVIKALGKIPRAGVPQNVIMSISGHKTDSMLRRYDKVDREDRRAALEQVKKLRERPPFELVQTA